MRHWRKRGVAPDTRPRRKRQSDARSLRAICAQTLGRRGAQRNTPQAAKLQRHRISGLEAAWYTRFLKTLKTNEIAASAQSPRLPHYSSTAAVSLFMRHPDKLEEVEQEQLTAFRRAAPSLETTYQLVQDFLVMMREPRRRALGCLALAGS